MTRKPPGSKASSGSRTGPRTRATAGREAYDRATETAVPASPKESETPKLTKGFKGPKPDVASKSTHGAGKGEMQGITLNLEQI